MRLGRQEATNACVQLGLRFSEDLWDTENLLQSDLETSRDPVSRHAQKMKENDQRGRWGGRREGKGHDFRKAHDFVSSRLFNTKKLELPK